MKPEQRKIIEEMTKQADALIFGIKDEAYNRGGVELDDYFPHDWKSADTFINKHYMRLRSLMASGNLTPKGTESIQDNFLDLLNYIRLSYAVLKSQGKLDCPTTLKPGGK